MNAIERMEHYAAIAGNANATVRVALMSLRFASSRLSEADPSATRHIQLAILDLERFVRDSDERVDMMRREEAA